MCEAVASAQKAKAMQALLDRKKLLASELHTAFATIFRW
jgi:hypothetical protein